VSALAEAQVCTVFHFSALSAAQVCTVFPVSALLASQVCTVFTIPALSAAQVNIFVFAAYHTQVGQVEHIRLFMKLINAKFSKKRHRLITCKHSLKYIFHIPCILNVFETFMF
jgi:hypothetical protein